jgi:hypothetical protein
MNELPFLPVTPLISKKVLRTNSAIDQRLEQILDLTRRLRLLEDLLSTAQARRRARDSEINAAAMYSAEIDNSVGE